MHDAAVAVICSADEGSVKVKVTLCELHVSGGWHRLICPHAFAAQECVCMTLPVAARMPPS